MGKAYYYFAATLPTLDFEGKLPFTGEEFLGNAKRLLDEKDYKLLDALLQDTHPFVSNKLLQEWNEFNRTFKNGLVIYRAGRANKDPLKYIRGEYFEDPSIQALIQEAEKASDPLEAEKVLSKARWQFLDDIGVGQYFNLEFIVLFGLKLQILERYQVIQSPKGKEIYEELKKIEFPEGIASSII